MIRHRCQVKTIPYSLFYFFFLMFSSTNLKVQFISLSLSVKYARKDAKKWAVHWTNLWKTNLIDLSIYCFFHSFIFLVTYANGQLPFSKCVKRWRRVSWVGETRSTYELLDSRQVISIPRLNTQTLVNCDQLPIGKLRDAEIRPPLVNVGLEEGVVKKISGKMYHLIDFP